MTDKEMLDEIVKLRSENDSLKERVDELANDEFRFICRRVWKLAIYAISLVPFYVMLACIGKFIGAW